MIFVTVGTHEQQFDRLIRYVDNLKRDGIITEEVVMQIGFCTYEPTYCKWNRLFSYKEMIQNVMDARIIITHGGPASFIMPLQMGKIPIIVPRQYRFKEHVNNHQVEFSKIVVERMKNVIAVYDIEKLQDTIMKYEFIIDAMELGIKSYNATFNMKFEKLVGELF